MRGYVLVTISAAIVGTVFALGALYRERDAQARAEALQFALERQTLQRQAADARLHLLTAQIEPHFLLNTLANVQALVESGSSRAVPVYRSLIDYLRAAVPQLQQECATLGDEERLVHAYLELMLMRMPDRLRFTVDIDPSLRALRFPPMALLTLVENAIRHGIDPGCEPGSIAVGGRRLDSGQVQLWVNDSGVGMSETAGMGTGLRNLDARVQAFFGSGATLELSEQFPHGLRAELRFFQAASRGRRAAPLSRNARRRRPGDPRRSPMSAATALIADDEPLLRERLVAHLARLWPELVVVAQARNGREAVDLFEQLQPGIAFLDVHLPGLSGVDVARCIDRRAEVAFCHSLRQVRGRGLRPGRDRLACQADRRAASARYGAAAAPAAAATGARTVGTIRRHAAEPGRAFAPATAAAAAAAVDQGLGRQRGAADPGGAGAVP